MQKNDEIYIKLLSSLIELEPNFNITTLKEDFIIYMKEGLKKPLKFASKIL